MIIKKKKSKSRFQASTFAGLGISVFVHLTIFLFVGSMVIFEGKLPNTPFFSEFLGEEPGVENGEVEMPLLEEETMDMSMDVPSDELRIEPAAPVLESEFSTVDLIVSSMPATTFSIPSGVGSPNLDIGAMGQGLRKSTETSSGKAGPLEPATRGAKTLFGFTQSFSGSLEGTMVDFKQNSKGDPTGMQPDEFGKELTKFVKNSKWDLEDLKDYYVVDKKLYTTHIYLPSMRADGAPKAFNVEKQVQPKMWMILYKGQFAAPTSGRFRFWGLADDYMLVKVDGKIVLDASLRVGRNGKSDINTPSEYNKNYIIGTTSAVGGDWLKLESGDRHEIEILIAEQPGGTFFAYLFIEEKGKDYKQGFKGRPTWPLFQTAEAEVEIKGSAPAYPRFTKEGGLFAP